MSDPIDNIRWLLAAQLEANAYNPNRVHVAELRLLERSLLETGWIQPLLVTADNVIIDGFHRWQLSQESKAIKARWKGRVPCAVLDVDLPTAMAITVRINRAKGTHIAVEMSALVHRLVHEHGWAPERVGREIGADMDEVNLLLADGVFEVKRTASWAYSPAWYPVEVPAQ